MKNSRIFNTERMKFGTRLVPNLRKKGYEFRLKKLRLTTLEIKRKRGDLIQFFKVQIGLDHIKWKKKHEINLVRETYDVRYMFL